MAPSAYDQTKAEIIRRVEKRCSAVIKEAKAFYEHDCQLVEDEYQAKKEQACHDLEQQKLKALHEIGRVYEAKMEPIKAKHAEELTSIREKYRITTPEAGLPASVTSETPSSPALVTASQQLADQQKAEAGNDNSPASSRTFADSQESGEETDTSIPAIAPQATNNAKPALLFKKRKRMPVIFDGGDEEPYFSQNGNKDERDDTSDVSFPGSQEGPSGRALKTFRRPSTQGSGRNHVSVASPTKTKNHSRQKEVDNIFEAQSRATSSSRKTDSQADGGEEDEDEDSGSGPASQAPRRNRVRPGRPEPGKYRMTAKAWPV